MSGKTKSRAGFKRGGACYELRVLRIDDPKGLFAEGAALLFGQLHELV
jgi:hypothetical protein